MPSFLRASPNARDAPRNPAGLDPFIPWLTEQLAAGGENASALYRQLYERGYPGSSLQIHRWVQTQRAAPAKSTPPRRPDRLPIPGQAEASPLASPRHPAWPLLQPAAKLEATQKATVVPIEQDREVSQAGALARRYTALVQASGGPHRRGFALADI